MGKRRHNNRDKGRLDAKRAKIVEEAESEKQCELEQEISSGSSCVRVQQKDKVETKVDVIIQDAQNNCRRSLTIWGSGLGVEKTIAVVEELKLSYLKQGTQFRQETSIKAGDNDEPHLQVILTLLGANNGPESEVTGET